MKRMLFVLLLGPVLGVAQPMEKPDSLISSFPLHPNDLVLSHLAQPTQYFDKIGSRAGLMGYESGQFEMWVWPWKPLRAFELSFLLGTSTQPISARDIVRSISVTPEVTTFTYTHEAFTVKAHVLVPRDEPGAILLLSVHTTAALSIIPGFIPVMQPMWPAGIGGQFSYWDDAANAYVISEGQWRAVFLCGSPAGRQMAAPPAHMFADSPLQFRIDIKPGETDEKFIPIVVAGALPDSLTGKMKFDSVKAVYTRLWKDAQRYYEENYSYYQNLRNSTIQVVTPDKDFNLAYEWGKIALDNLMVVNPRLGRGMVAGYGLSGGGARPGFAWFFGGDAFINSLAMNGYGDFAKARDALAFTQKWQRQDDFPIRKKDSTAPPKDVGKMAHELSQSDGICDWWNDYHYGYNHADTTPWYIVAVGDYVRTSGDISFLKRSWGSVKQAYDWCLSKDSDSDGLMDLKGAGLGALEFGKLVGIYADVYTCGVWVQAIKEMKYMANLLGDSALATQADAQFRRAQSQLEKKFWMEKEGFYTYGATEKGEQVHEKTPWSGVAMMFDLLDGTRTAKSIESYNGADMSTDWGVRSLSMNSDLFDPTNYNYGAVWPFISSFYNTAQFRHHFSLPGYQVLRANVRHAFDHSLGEVPEVFSGDLNEKLGEGYHHQGFSTTGYMLPFIKGLLGLEIDRVRNEVSLTPHFPSEWSQVIIKNIRLGERNLTFTLTAEPNSWLINAKGLGDGIKVTFSPALPATAEKIAPVGVPESSLEILDTGGDKHVTVTLPPHESSRVGLLWGNGLGIGLPDAYSAVGATNEGLKFISQKYQNRKLHLIVEGRSGETYHVNLFNNMDTDFIQSVEGGIYQEHLLIVSFDKTPKQQFVRREIVITMK